MKKFYLIAFVALGIGFTACNDEEQLDRVKVIDDSQPSAVISSKGFYVANEDWFGHDNGTVNYFQNDGSIVYRAYRAANPDEKLGVTTQFATIYGDYAYFVSKQQNRLVIADAKTLKKKAVFTDIGGDGRFFVGVDDKMGYLGHNAGVRQFNIETMQLGNAVEGISGETGTMCYAEGRLFVVSRNKLYVVNVATNTLETSLEGSFSTLTRSKDGTVWVAASDKMIKMTPSTLEQEEMAYPNGVSIASPWFAWNAGSLCASTQKNVLYWAKGSSWSSTAIVKYDIDTQVFTDDFYTLGMSDGKQQIFYGAGLRVDPLTDKIIATYTRSGYGGNYSFNWVDIINPDGSVEKNIVLKGDNSSADGFSGAGDGNYYWFPAVPFFEDANKPEILTNQILLAPGETKTINLMEKMIDADNAPSTIIRNVEFAANDLVTSSIKDGVLTVTAKDKIGSTECTMIAISNGKRVEKKVRVDVAFTE